MSSALKIMGLVSPVKQPLSTSSQASREDRTALAKETTEEPEDAVIKVNGFKQTSHVSLVLQLGDLFCNIMD